MSPDNTNLPTATPNTAEPPKKMRKTIHYIADKIADGLEFLSQVFAKTLTAATFKRHAPQADKENNISQQIADKKHRIADLSTYAKGLMAWGILAIAVAVVFFAWHYYFYSDSPKESISALTFELVNTVDDDAQSRTKIKFDANQIKTLQQFIKTNPNSSTTAKVVASAAFILWSLAGLLLLYIYALSQQIAALQTKKQFTSQILDTKLNTYINKWENMRFIFDTDIVSRITFFKKMTTPQAYTAATEALLSDADTCKTSLLAAYTTCYADNHHNIEHYLHYLCFILDFIEKSAIDESEKNAFRADLMASVLTEELAIWYLYALSAPKFGEYLTKYQLLKNINWAVFFKNIGATELYQTEQQKPNFDFNASALNIFKTLLGYPAFGEAENTKI
jgi:hypothetical protein